MTFLIVILVQALSLVVNYFIARYHAKLFDQNKRISHFWWALGFCALFIPAIAIHWLLFIAVLAIRLPFFNIILNYLRGKPVFYYGKGKDGSVIDRYLGESYPVVYALCIWIAIFCNVIMEEIL